MENVDVKYQSKPRAQDDEGREWNLTLYCKLFGNFYKVHFTPQDITQRNQSANPEGIDYRREARESPEEQTDREPKFGIAETHSPTSG